MVKQGYVFVYNRSKLSDYLYYSLFTLQVVSIYFIFISLTYSISQGQILYI